MSPQTPVGVARASDRRISEPASGRTVEEVGTGADQSQAYKLAWHDREARVGDKRYGVAADLEDQLGLQPGPLHKSHACRYTTRIIGRDEFEAVGPDAERDGGAAGYGDRWRRPVYREFQYSLNVSSKTKGHCNDQIEDVSVSPRPY